MAPRKIFISYARKDEEWLERLRVHLKPLERGRIIDPWDDSKIVPGSKWKDEIREALEAAQIAILLITADFLASDFIAEDELPPLLDAAQQRGLVVLPVIISPSRFASEPGLSQFQAVNDASRPLSALSRNDQEAVWVRVAKVVEEALPEDSDTPAERSDTAGEAGATGEAADAPGDPNRLEEQQDTALEAEREAVVNADPEATQGAAEAPGQPDELDPVLEGFARKAYDYGADERVALKLPVAWPEDISYALRAARMERGPRLTDLEERLERRRPSKFRLAWERRVHAVKQAARINGVKVVFGVVVLLAGLVALMPVLTPFAETEISFWTTRETPVTIPEEIAPLPLNFTLDDQTFQRATLVTATIQNSGKTDIGSEAVRHRVTLLADEDAHIMTLSELARTPDDLDAELIPAASPSRSLTLELGLFEPNDQVELQFLIVNPANPENPSLVLDTERGSQIETAEGNPDTRIRDVYLWPIGLVFLIVVFLLGKDSAAAEIRGLKPRNRFDKVIEIIQMIMGMVMIVVFLTAGATFLVVMIVTWIWL